MKKHNLLLLYIIIFVFHFSLLFGISVLVKERKISPKDFVQVDFVDVSTTKKPPEKKIVEQKKKVEEGLKDSSDDRVEVAEETPLNGAEYPVFPEKKIKSRLEYPEEASDEGIEGCVVLELYIDKHGYIKEAEVVTDPGHGFARAAVRAFKGLKCIPAKMDGLPIAVKLRKTVRFVLE